MVRSSRKRQETEKLSCYRIISSSPCDIATHASHIALESTSPHLAPLVRPRPHQIYMIWKESKGLMYKTNQDNTNTAQKTPKNLQKETKGPCTAKKSIQLYPIQCILRYLSEHKWTQDTGCIARCSELLWAWGDALLVHNVSDGAKLPLPLDSLGFRFARTLVALDPLKPILTSSYIFIIFLHVPVNKAIRIPFFLSLRRQTWPF